MNKLGKILICAGLLFSAAACSKKDPVDDKALDKLEAVIKQSAKYQSADYEVKAVSAVNKEAINMKAFGSFVLSDKPQFSLTLDFSSGEQNIKNFAGFYIYDNTLYLNMMGSKTKTTYTSGENNVTEITEKGKKLNHKSLKKYLKKASYDNGKIDLVIDGKKAMSYIKKKNGDASALAIPYKNISLQDINLEITYDKKEYLTGLSVDTSMYIKDESATLSFEAKLSKRDQISNIKLPDDLNTYQDSGTLSPENPNLLPGQGL